VGHSKYAGRAREGVRSYLNFLKMLINYTLECLPRELLLGRLLLLLLKAIRVDLVEAFFKGSCDLVCSFRSCLFNVARNCLTVLGCYCSLGNRLLDNEF
jgi:hypothetical protein